MDTMTDPSPSIPDLTDETPQKIRKGFDIRYLFVLMILIGVVGGTYTLLQKPKEEVVVPTPTQIPTPTPVGKVKLPLATTSAFLEISASVASLSSSLSALQINDTTLVPPQVELPLGFANE
jgi:hypothetical protein